jgi:hypothetical protein
VHSANRPDALQYGCTSCVSLLGLPALIGIDRSTMANSPILRAPASRVQRFAMHTGPGQRCRMGIVVTGNIGRTDDWCRSVPPGLLGELAALPGIDWFNLCVEARPEAKQVVQLFSATDLIAHVSDFADSAALVAGMDGVVTIDCATAHLAGILGKPCWLLAPTMLDWRWRIGDTDSPWWPTVRTYRAGGPVPDWRQAVAALALDLAQFAGARNGVAAD